MLCELIIRNFAIIDEQTIPFRPGLNVLSGQTGSGKSIILNALELILGARPKSEYIREGAEQLEVEAFFDLSGLDSTIYDELPDIAKAKELAISRSLNIAGKGKVLINGRLATVGVLEEISSKIINICGQGQFIRLLNANFHRALIDEFANNQEVLEDYSRAYTQFQKLLKKQKEFLEQNSKGEIRRSELNELIAELQAIDYKAGLRQELEETVKRLESGEKIISGLETISSAFDETGGLLDKLSTLDAKLFDIGKLDPNIAELGRRLHSSRGDLQELCRDLGRYSDKIELNEEALQLKREQLAELARLERKYRTNDVGLAKLLEQARTELKTLEQGGLGGNFEKDLSDSREEVNRIALLLRQRREEAGQKLVKLVASDLKALNMPDAKLKLVLDEISPGSYGTEMPEILISTNKGEAFKPLKQIASGGELSRIMLVLKKNLRERSGVNVLVFDEIDTGISGAVARAVGEMLKSLANHSQVICITHLAQVASLADHHLLVDKKVGKRAISLVRTIEGKEKIEEIARMLAGYEVTQASRESARELLSSNTKQ
jgi:DNA repair protein RecN (Recombination protein N)